MDIARSTAPGSRVESFRMAVAADPLFAAEGMDIERAERNLSRVSAALRELQRALAAGSLARRLFLWRYPLGKYAVPIDFVRLFIESERARRAFLLSPTESNARALLRVWKKAAQSYALCVSRYRALHDVLRALDPEEKELQFQDMFGNVSDIEYIERTLEQMRQNAEALEDEVEEYARLLSGERAHKVPRTAGSTLPAYESGRLPEELEWLQQLRMRERIPFSQSQTLESHGPVRYTLPHFDGAQTPHLFTVSVLRDDRSGIEHAYVALVDEFYFLKIMGPDANFGGMGRANFDEIIEAGIPYWHQNATTLYTMRDQTYWGDLTALADIHRRPVLDARLVAAQRSSMFDLMLGACALDIRNYTGHTRDRVHKRALDSYSFLFGLFMRSHPSIYYLPFNGSVWRLEEPLDIRGCRRLSSEKIRYRPLKEVLPEVGKDMMEKIMKSARIRWDSRKKRGIAGI